ncbi:hypothetical protein [Streptomyces sp. NPDC057340]
MAGRPRTATIRSRTDNVAGLKRTYGYESAGRLAFTKGTEG